MRPGLRMRNPADRADAQRVITADDEREPAFDHHGVHACGQISAHPGNRFEIAQLFVGLGSWQRFKRGHADVACIGHCVTKRVQSGAQAGVANRARSHIDTAASRTQVDRDPDDGDFVWHWSADYTTLRRGSVR
jgi:hypothetical protein